jgi:hypothetical protein
MIVSELLGAGEIDRLLRDSFGNYVIQTALDYASPMSKHRLIEAIRPILPSIRATPYGRRIQAKIQTYDTRTGPSTAGQVLPTDAAGGQISIRPTHNRPMPNGASILATGAYANGANGVNGVNGAGANTGTVYPSSTVIAVPAPQNQTPQQPQRGQQFSPQYTPMGSENGEAQWV